MRPTRPSRFRPLILFAVSLIGIFFSAPSIARDELPSYRGSFNDLAEVISPKYRSRIMTLAEDLEQRTSAELVVVTVPSIAPLTEAQYAQALFDKWKPGKKDKNNGVLVLVAVKERRWRIHTGYGMEGILPDALCSRIAQTWMVPHLTKGEYSEGLYYAVAAIARVIARDAGVMMNDTVVPAEKVSDGGTSLLWLFVAAFFLFMINVASHIVEGIALSAFFILIFSFHEDSKLILWSVCGGLLGLILKYPLACISSDYKGESFREVMTKDFGDGSGGSSGSGGGGSSGGGGAGGGY